MMLSQMDYLRESTQEYEKLDWKRSSEEFKEVIRYCKELEKSMDKTFKEAIDELDSTETDDIEYKVIEPGTRIVKTLVAGGNSGISNGVLLAQLME